SPESTPCPPGHEGSHSSERRRQGLPRPEREYAGKNRVFPSSYPPVVRRTGMRLESYEIFDEVNFGQLGRGRTIRSRQSLLGSLLAHLPRRNVNRGAVLIQGFLNALASALLHDSCASSTRRKIQP